MNIEDNPLLKPEDFFAGYNKSMEDFKNRPELVAFDKLCHELFTSEAGKKWMEYVEENYLIAPIVDRNAPNFHNMALWSEGFKDFPRMLRGAVRSHNQRINAGVKQ